MYLGKQFAIKCSMILVCPKCSARFLVPATVFSTGPRQVRCAKCSHSWKADLPAVEVAAMMQSLQNLSPPPAGGPDGRSPLNRSEFKVPTVYQERNWGRNLAYGFLTLMGVMLVVSMWLVLDRQSIAAKSPVMEGYYQKIGLKLAYVADGLNLKDVRSERVSSNGEIKLLVEGNVVNENEQSAEFPEIMATALGPDGAEMTKWKIPAPQETLKGGETVPFRSEIAVPEGPVAEVNLGFIGLRHDREKQ